MDADLIYDDEILPEIEIRELLTLADLVAMEPSFIAYSWREINILYQQLFHDVYKANTFQALHRSVLEPKAESYLKHIIPLVAAKRTTRNDDTGIEYLTEIDDAKKAPNYALQQKAEDRVFCPITSSLSPGAEADKLLYLDFEQPEVQASEAIMAPVAPITSVCDIELDDTERSRTWLLSCDPIALYAKGARWKVNGRSKYDYVHETRHKTRPLPFVEWNNFTGDAIDWSINHVRPAFSSVVKEIKEVADLHNIKRTLSLYGFDWYSLELKEMRKLEHHISSLATTDEDMKGEGTGKKQKLAAADKVVHETAASKLRHENFMPIWSAMETLRTRALSFAVDDVKMKTESIFTSYLQSLPALPSSVDLPDPYIILAKLHENTVTSEEVVDTLKAWYTRWDLDITERFMKRFRNWNLVPELAASLISQFQKIDGVSLKGDMPSALMNTWTEMQEIVLGMDTSDYDGAPKVGVQMTFDEISNATIALQEDEQPQPQDIQEMSKMTAMLNMPAQIYMNLSSGAREVFSFAWRRCARIAQSSGLPWGGECYMTQCTNYIIRKDRETQLMEAVPSLSAVAARNMLFPRMSMTMEYIKENFAPPISTQLEQVYPAIYREWEEACYWATVHLMTIWWLDICKQSVQGTLKFNALTAMIQFVGLWNRGGPPMETIAESQSRTGIIFYMTAIVHFLNPSIPQEKIAKDMMSTADEYHADSVREIREKWVKQKDTNRIMDKAKAARISLLEAIQAIKQKKKVNLLPPYLQALLYLPGNLHTRKTKTQRWIQGCCATKLNEHFEADIDWKETWTDLYIIKQGLAKKRWSQESREAFFQVASPHTASSKKAKVSEGYSIVATVEEGRSDVEKVKDEVSGQEWIPVSHREMLLHRTSDIIGWAKTVFGRIFETAKLKVSVCMELLEQWTDSQMFLSWISKVQAKWVEDGKDEEEGARLGHIKRWIESLKQNGEDIRPYLQYAFVAAFAFPATVQLNTVIYPETLTKQDLIGAWNNAYETTQNWVKYGRLLTTEEIQGFITKKREQQKQVALGKLDVLNTDDRQVMQDAKKLNLFKLVNVGEIAKDEDDVVADFAGEEEWNMRSTDMEGVAEESTDDY